jgi:hypothetical protein
MQYQQELEVQRLEEAHQQEVAQLEEGRQQEVQRLAGQLARSGGQEVAQQQQELKEAREQHRREVEALQLQHQLHDLQRGQPQHQLQPQPAALQAQ